MVGEIIGAVAGMVVKYCVTDVTGKVLDAFKPEILNGANKVVWEVGCMGIGAVVSTAASKHVLELVQTVQDLVDNRKESKELDKELDKMIDEIDSGK